MLNLQRNVPPPARREVRQGDGRKKYPFEKMKIGDFFFVPGKERAKIRTYFSTAGTQYGIKLKSEQIHARKDGHGQWVRCEAGDEDAVSGVGVWRVELPVRN